MVGWYVSLKLSLLFYPCDAYFPPFNVKSCLDTLFTRSSTVYIQIVHADYLRRTAQLSAVVHVEQPWNSVEKLFSVSRTVRSAEDDSGL